MTMMPCIRLNLLASKLNVDSVIASRSRSVRRIDSYGHVLK
jgi:hypothetical protein